MRVPDFILRKLYKRGSLREVGTTHFAFAFQNPLGTATVVGPPRFVVNGIAYDAGAVACAVDLVAISKENPYRFTKGTTLEFRFPGRLLRGGNRIVAQIHTKEFGPVEIYVEDKEAAYCDVPASDQRAPSNASK